MSLYICNYIYVNYVTNSIYTNNIIQFDNISFGEDFCVLHFNLMHIKKSEKEDKELWILYV